MGPPVIEQQTRPRDMMHWPGRSLLALVVGALLGLALAGPAAAHATLLFAGPAVGGAVPASPPAITLLFDEPVTPGSVPVRVIDGGGQAIRLGPARSEQRDRAVTVPLTQQLGRGVFEVRWQVLASDGDPVGGSFRFVVGPATTLAVAGAGSDGAQQWSPALVASSFLRWLLFAALSVALGGIVGSGIVRRHGGPRPVPSPWTGRAALVGSVATVGLVVLIAGNGDLRLGMSVQSLSAVTAALPGRLALAEVVGFAAAGVMSRTCGRRWAWLPLLGVVVAEGLRSHAASTLPGWGALLTGIHLLAAAIWVGALAQVVRTALAWRSTPRRSWAAIRAYAQLAGWLFAAVVATGTGSALLLVPWGSWTTTDYGRVLLTKLTLVVLVSVLAVLGRRRLRLRPDQAAPSARRRSARLEVAVLVVVLATTAVLVSLPPPAPLGKVDLSVPPPPTGVVVPLGARAGMIGVSSAASAGQLVVHLSAPLMGNNEQGAPDPTVYRLDGRVSITGRGESPLSWRGCGPGCFVAPLTWGNGPNVVVLDAAADGWPGGRVSLTVPWPTSTDAGQLRALVAAMAQVPTLTVHEQVTSDSSTGPGQVRTLTMSGKTFMGVEPYGSGAAPQVALLRAGGGRVTLAVGFPGDLTQAELVIDAQHRLLRESLTAPNHSVTRSFDYPRP